MSPDKIGVVRGVTPRITVKRNSILLYTLALAAVPALSSAQSWISSSPSATIYYGGSLFNLTNNSTSAVRLTGLFDLNLGGAGGTAATYRVYTKGSALVGTETNPAPWTLLGSASVASSNPQNSFTTIDVNSGIELAAGATIGVGIFVTTANLANDGWVGYNSGAGTFSDGTLTLAGGIGKGYAGVGDGTAAESLFNVIPSVPNRTFSGRVQYASVTPVPEPATMAAIGLGLVGFVSRRRKRA